MPLDLLVGRVCCRRKEHWKHIYISLFILIGVALSVVSFQQSLSDDDEKKDSYDYIWFLNLFMVGQLLNVLSHQVKEYVVRNILVNQSKFQFQVAFT